LAAGHCGQAIVKKIRGSIYNFWFAPENWLSRDSSPHEGRLASEEGRLGKFIVELQQEHLEG